MNIITTEFEGLYIIEPNVFDDNRGYFFESYNKNEFFKHGLSANFVQDNESKSSYGVIRGLHYQIEPYAQTKLIRAIQGKILDVVLDIRENSKTYGKYFSVELSDENKHQFYIPRGFAHGFSVLSETTIVNYKCDNFYNKNAERGIYPIDEKLNIDWKIEKKHQLLSEKDKQWQSFDKTI